MTDLATLRAKDLSIEIRQEFIAAMNHVCNGPIQEPGATISLMIDSMKDTEINIMVHRILNMYDEVTRYQPIPYSARAPNVSRP